MTDVQFLECKIRMPMMDLPVRTTVVTLSNAKIMISPGSKLTKEDLKKAGAVTDIIAPCMLHCGGVQQAREVFPQARVWGPKGVEQVKPEIPWNGFLDEKTWPYQDELRLIELKGLPRNNECVFVHKKSKLLIVQDLFFNMREPKGFGAWLFTHLFGTYDRFALSRLFKIFIKDKHAFQVSAQQILEEDFTKVAVGHGNIFDGGPAEVLAAFQERGFKV